MLRAVHAAPGQTVAAGAPLFDLVRLDPVWIRVAAVRGRARRRRPARAGAHRPARRGRRIARRRRAAGRRAAVRRPGDGRGRSLLRRAPTPAARCVPASGSACACRWPPRRRAWSCRRPPCSTTPTAARGSTRRAPSHAFVRRRVSVRDLVDGMAVLDVGPAAGHEGRDGRRGGAVRDRVRGRQVKGAIR